MHNGARTIRTAQRGRASAPARGRLRAFSYIEAVIATFILAIGVTAGMNLYGSYARGARSDIDIVTARELANGLLCEILPKRFEEPSASPLLFGANTGEAQRADFDDVDDYHGLTEAPPENPDGTPLAPGTYDAYTRAVIVQNVGENALTTVATDGTTAAKRIEVAVSRGNRPIVKVVGYRMRHDGDS